MTSWKWHSPATFLLLLVIALGPSEPAEARPPGVHARSIPAARQEPGTLLSYDRIGLPRNYRAIAWRIRYVTRDYALRPILSTGTVVLPSTAPATPSSRKVVAWAHLYRGTVMRHRTAPVMPPI